VIRDRHLDDQVNPDGSMSQPVTFDPFSAVERLDSVLPPIGRDCGGAGTEVRHV
jgi:hypothetical protein